MHAFQRRACHQSVLPRNLEQSRTFDYQEGPESLTAAKAGVPHGFDQARWPGQLAFRRRCRQKPAEQVVNVFGRGVKV